VSTHVSWAVDTVRPSMFLALPLSLPPFTVAAVMPSGLASACPRPDAVGVAAVAHSCDAVAGVSFAPIPGPATRCCYCRNAPERGDNLYTRFICAKIACA